MIYDKIENAGKYKGISQRLDKALDFLKNMKPEELVVGKYELEGSDLFYLVQEYETVVESSGKYETHQNYIDIQLLVSGTEIIRCTIYDNPNITQPYNADNDIEFYSLDKGYDFRLIPGTFVLVMPGELHAPKIMETSIQHVKKIVVKIRI